MASQPLVAPTASEPDPLSPSQPRTTKGRLARLGDLMAEAKPLSQNERDAIEEIRALAREYDGDPVKLGVARRTTTGRQRFFAVRHTAPNHPDFAALHRMIGDLIRSDGDTVVTAQGMFTTDEIRAESPKIERESGRERICFPIRQPWLQKPTAADPNGVPGIPVYRRPEDRRPTFSTFRPGPSGGAQPAPEPEWWQEPDEET